MGKFRTVNDDQDIRLGRDNGIGRFADATKYFWQARWYCRKSDHREITEREKTRHPLRRHKRAADTGELSVPLRVPPDGSDQRST
jgi:hypothetical protein